MIFSCHHQGLHGRHAQTQQVLQFALSFIIQHTTRVLRLAQQNHTQHGTNTLPWTVTMIRNRKTGRLDPILQKRNGSEYDLHPFSIKIMRVENNNAVRSWPHMMHSRNQTKQVRVRNMACETIIIQPYMLIRGALEYVMVTKHWDADTNARRRCD